MIPLMMGKQAPSPLPLALPTTTASMLGLTVSRGECRLPARARLLGPRLAWPAARQCKLAPCALDTPPPSTASLAAATELATQLHRAAQRLWYAFNVEDAPAAFDQKMESLIREIGQRGRKGAARLPEAVPPALTRSASSPAVTGGRWDTVRATVTAPITRLPADKSLETLLESALLGTHANAFANQGYTCSARTYSKRTRRSYRSWLGGWAWQSQMRGGCAKRLPAQTPRRRAS